MSFLNDYTHRHWEEGGENAFWKLNHMNKADTHMSFDINILTKAINILSTYHCITWH